MKRKFRFPALLLAAAFLLNLTVPLAASAEGSPAPLAATAETAPAETEAEDSPAPAPSETPAPADPAAATAETAVTFAAGGIEPMSQLAPINPEYLEYLRDKSNGGRNGYIPSTLDLSYLAQSAAQQPQLYAMLPSSYDLRDTGLVGPVRDQGYFGTCWTFSALGAAESSLLRQFSSLDLSESHLAWFSYMGQAEQGLRYPRITDPFDEGGNDTISVGTLAAWKGPVTEETLPYPASGTADVPNYSDKESLRYAADYHLQDAYFMNVSTDGTSGAVTGNDSIKALLMEQGALAVSYHSPDIGQTDVAIYNSKPLDTNHAVLMVGWDDNYSRDNFTRGAKPQNNGAWLIRNSWGSSVQDGGYFWLSYEDKTIRDATAYLLESKDNYTNNYQYDITGWGDSISADTFYSTDQAQKYGYISNIFTAKGNEQLEAVGFYTTDLGSEYEISVYTDVTDGQPASGQLVLDRQTGSEPYVGYHTIELDTPVPLSANENYAVVVKLTNPTYAYPLATELYTAGYNDDPPAASGKSFYSADGVQWQSSTSLYYNLSDYCFYSTNLCLKAFTNPLPMDGTAISSVHFSLLSGPIALGSTLTLDGPTHIQYQIDSGEVKDYTAPLTVDHACTVTAWGLQDGKTGNKISRSYTEGQAELIDATLKQGETEYPLTFDASGSATLFLPSNSEISLRPRSAGTLTVNGATVASNSWSTAFTPFGDDKDVDTVTITAAADGRTTSTYTVTLTSSGSNRLTFDYQNETVHYDDTNYTVVDPDGSVIANGASVTGLVDSIPADKSSLLLTINDKSGSKVGQYLLPCRPYRNLKISIDYASEKTYDLFLSQWSWSQNSDLSDATVCSDNAIPLTPGTTVYLKRSATKTQFASSVISIVAPPRPATPTAAVDSVGPDTITMQTVEGAQYRIDPQQLKDSKWQDSPILTGLEPSTGYTVQIYFPASGEAFSSEIGTVTAATAAGVSLPVQFWLEGRLAVEDRIWLAEGKNTVDLTSQLNILAMHTANGSPATATVNVIKQGDGTLSADPALLRLDVLLPKPLSAYTYTVIWFDAGNNYRQVGKKDVSFTHIGELPWSEVSLPDGYELAAEFLDNPEEAPTGLFLSQNGHAWYAKNLAVSVPVKMTVPSSTSSPSPTPSSAPIPFPTASPTVTGMPEPTATPVVLSAAVTPAPAVPAAIPATGDASRPELLVVLFAFSGIGLALVGILIYHRRKK